MVHPHSNEGKREQDRYQKEYVGGDAEGFCGHCQEFTHGEAGRARIQASEAFTCDECNKTTSPFFPADTDKSIEWLKDRFSYIHEDVDFGDGN